MASCLIGGMLANGIGKDEITVAELTPPQDKRLLTFIVSVQQRIICLQLHQQRSLFWLLNPK